MENLSITLQARSTLEPANQASTGNSAQRTRERDAPSEESSIFAFNLAAVQTLHIERAASALNVHGSTPQDAQSVAAPDTRDQSRSAQSQASQSASDTPQRQSTHSPERPSTSPPQPFGASASLPQQNNVPASLPQAPFLASAPNNAGSLAGAQIIASNTAARPAQTATITPNGPFTRENAALNRPNALSSAQTKAPVQETNFARLVANRVNTGETRFEVRLDPPELGRIDVRLVADARQDARQSANLTLTFEHQSTRDLFRQDEQALRDLLKDHGFEVGSQDLTFDLDHQSNDQQANARDTTHGVSAYEKSSWLPIETPVSSHAAYVSPHHYAANAHLLNVTA